MDWQRFLDLVRIDTGVDLYHREHGSGEPILFIHGFGLSGYTWRYLMPTLAKDHRVISIDLRGHGESPKPKDTEYSVYDQARLIVQFILKSGLSHLTVVGHSLGGWVALVTSLYLAENDSERLRRLILIDSAGYPQRLPSFIRTLATPILGPLVAQLRPKSSQVRSALSFAYFNKRGLSEHTVETYAKALRLPGAANALIQTAKHFKDAELHKLIARYGTIPYPTLLIWGREDRVTPLEIGRNLHTAIPKSKLMVLDQCGHIPQEELPIQTLNIVQDFLS
jgi:pimeloyl-ACP methyl ester carboxylesterase